jgi:hypothetical protein
VAAVSGVSYKAWTLFKQQEFLAAADAFSFFRLGGYAGAAMYLRQQQQEVQALLLPEGA